MASHTPTRRPAWPAYPGGAHRRTGHVRYHAGLTDRRKETIRIPGRGAAMISALFVFRSEADRRAWTAQGHRGQPRFALGETEADAAAQALYDMPLRFLKLRRDHEKSPEHPDQLVPAALLRRRSDG